MQAKISQVAIQASVYNIHASKTENSQEVEHSMDMKARVMLQTIFDPELQSVARGMQLIEVKYSGAVYFTLWDRGLARWESCQRVAAVGLI